MVCIYWAKRRRTKANLDTIIIPFAEAGKTVVIVDDDEPLVHIEIPHPLCNEQATPPGWRAGHFAARSSAEKALLNSQPSPNRHVSADQPVALTSNTNIDI